MELAMLNKSKKLFSGSNKLGNVSIINDESRWCFRWLSIKGFKVSGYSLLVSSLLSFGQVNAQGVEVRGANNMVITVSKLPQVFFKSDLHRVGNKIKLLPPISFSGEIVSKPSAENERRNGPVNSPDKSDKNRVGIKQSDKATPKIADHFYFVLLIQLLVFFFMFPLGCYFSDHISPRILAKRKRWMKLHTLKAERFHRDNPNEHYMMPRKTFCQWLWF